MRTTELRDKDTASLRKKKSQILREMPDLGGVMRGSLIERFLRCGKANCKCQVGRGHGPKCYVSISHPKGRPEMLYVPKAWCDQVRKSQADFASMRGILEEISAINAELVRRREEL